MRILRRIYKNKDYLAMLCKIEDNEYHLGEISEDGGVRPNLFFSRKEVMKYLKRNNFKSVAKVYFD